MSDRPIIFSAHSMQMIFAGKKDQTRRLGATWARVRAGDLLWVKETWTYAKGNGRRVVYRADIDTDRWPKSVTRPDDKAKVWRSSMFMPREHSRMRLRVVTATTQRLQDISESDALDEGADRFATARWAPSARAAFRIGWCELHGSDAWDANPLVYRIAFARILLEVS